MAIKAALLLLLIPSLLYSEGAFLAGDYGLKPVVQMHLDEGAGTTFSVGKFNSATLSGSAVWTQGKFGKAVYFPVATNAKLGLTDIGYPSGNAARTLSLWYKQDTPNQGSASFFWYGDDTTTGRWQATANYGTSDGNITVGFYSAVTYDAKVSQSGWNFIYITESGGANNVETVMVINAKGNIFRKSTLRTTLNTVVTSGRAAIGNDPGGSYACGCTVDDLQFFGGSDNVGRVASSYWRGVSSDPNN